ncbi:MAG TPA: signal peptidase I [Pseudonocardiaceae bacterium]|nr:signal peptidase I [Pseudonocardiaceae bacterium]
MDDTGRQIGARRGQQPRRNGARRPVSGSAGGPPDDGAPDGFEQGWFGKPDQLADRRNPGSGRMPPVPRPDASSGRMPPVPRPDQSSGRMPPVPRPHQSSRGLPPVPEPFDRERFDEALTDPGPFSRVPFETQPVKPVPPPDDDLYDRLYGDDPQDDPRDPEPPAKAKRDEKRKRKMPFWIELPVLIVVALLFTFLVQTFVARVYVIPSGSMERTLNGNNGTGDRILVDKVVYDFHGPRPGDVIVFKGPPGWDQTEFFPDSSSNPVVGWLRQLGASIGVAKPNEYDLVKRVIAVGGQTVKCCDAQNRVLVDDKPLDEPYVYWQPGRPGPAQQLHFGPVTVPRGYLWVEGDNRSNSDDSRYQDGGGSHGVVPVANVIGKARTIIWPPSRWQGIGDHDPQSQAVALPAPGWPASTGIGALATLPTLWLGRRFRPALRAAAGIKQAPRSKKRG